MFKKIQQQYATSFNQVFRAVNWKKAAQCIDYVKQPLDGEVIRSKHVEVLFI
jgi:hypothetical protein